MRHYLLPAVAIAAAVLGAESSAAVKNAPYPEIKVKLSKSFKPDAGFDKMRAAFADATAKKGRGRPVCADRSDLRVDLRRRAGRPVRYGPRRRA